MDAEGRSAGKKFGSCATPLTGRCQHRRHNSKLSFRAGPLRPSSSIPTLNRHDLARKSRANETLNLSLTDGKNLTIRFKKMMEELK